jgi:hypothetical protein
MDTQKRVEGLTSADKPVSVPQMRVRSDVRSGDDLSTCQFNVNKWKQRYYDAYSKAHAQGCV